MENQRRAELLELDDDATKKVRLEVAEFYRKLNPTAFLDWIMSMEDYVIGMQCPKIENFV